MSVLFVFFSRVHRGGGLLTCKKSFILLLKNRIHFFVWKLGSGRQKKQHQVQVM